MGHVQSKAATGERGEGARCRAAMTLVESRRRTAMGCDRERSVEESDDCAAVVRPLDLFALCSRDDRGVARRRRDLR